MEAGESFHTCLQYDKQLWQSQTFTHCAVYYDDHTAEDGDIFLFFTVCTVLALTEIPFLNTVQIVHWRHSSIVSYWLYLWRLSVARGCQLNTLLECFQVIKVGIHAVPYILRAGKAEREKTWSELHRREFKYNHEKIENGKDRLSTEDYSKHVWDDKPLKAQAYHLRTILMVTERTPESECPIVHLSTSLLFEFPSPLRYFRRTNVISENRPTNFDLCANR